MSLYNLLCGMNPSSDALLALLGLTREDCGRFRDCWLVEEGEDHKPEIHVYTRNGGGNREHWAFSYENEAGEECKCPGCIIEHKLPKHPNYLSDHDDSFDCTYATIHFSVPEEHLARVNAMLAEKP